MFYVNAPELMCFLLVYNFTNLVMLYVSAPELMHFLFIDGHAIVSGYFMSNFPQFLSKIFWAYLVKVMTNCNNCGLHKIFIEVTAFIFCMISAYIE